MDGMTYYDSLKTGLENGLDNERQRFERVKHQRNAASIADLASNLLNLAGYSKGARVSLATNNVAKQQGVYEQARERYNAAMKDYQAKIADVNLRQKIKENNAVPLKTVGFLSPAAPAFSRKSPNTIFGLNGSPFSKGVLGRMIKDYKSNN